ncbi:phosphotransferase [Ornithinimicrobium sp. F0845]|uniref:phosphotransferase enzyme family protein n=1 Tax=Ornithinimicrobium sp. F0845 TaxID=2926412 RepID=UPI001FF4E63D|nr:phosphotransferase [Ornithinimicrobium sp. F0845]MCK0113552.1 phosphotransferase [Ornithinimicrobium sp. F0845]
MTHRASADLLIDRQRLSEVLGREVRATRLRFKPGLSTSAVLLDASGGSDAPGWIQVSHPGHTDKIRKAVELAGERGQHVHLLQTDGLTVAHGTVDTDPRLQKGLDGLRSVHPSVTDAVAAGRLSVLRYNPQRRLVLHRDLPSGESLVLRVTAEKQIGVRAALRDLASAGVPVVEPVEAPGHRLGRRVTVWPWFGRGDLATLPDGGGPAYAAGSALARLHRSAIRTGPVPDPVGALVRQAEDLAGLDGAAATRMQAQTSALAARIASGRWATGPIHGDFSADQVLVGRAGEDTVRLTDFDRAGRGPLMADLGSFAAAELLAGGGEWAGLQALPLTRELLAGYRETQDPDAADPGTDAADPGADAGATGATDDGLFTWVARSLLSRALEPFRAAEPDWVDGIHRRMDQVQQVLT